MQNMHDRVLFARAIERRNDEFYAENGVDYVKYIWFSDETYGKYRHDSSSKNISPLYTLYTWYIVDNSKWVSIFGQKNIDSSM